MHLLYYKFPPTVLISKEQSMNNEVSCTHGTGNTYKLYLNEILNLKQNVPLT